VSRTQDYVEEESKDSDSGNSEETMSSSDDESGKIHKCSSSRIPKAFTKMVIVGYVGAQILF
jgi:hypothetical protein